MEETQMVNLIQQILRKICSVFNTKPSFNSTNLMVKQKQIKLLNSKKHRSIKEMEDDLKKIKSHKN